MAAKKRRLHQRTAEVGAEVEESIRQHGDEEKMHHVDQVQLFQVDNVGGDDQVLTKKQKLLQKDPMIRSKKFKEEKASRAEIEKIKKIQQNMTIQTKPKSKNESIKKKLVGVWGDDGTVTIPKEIKELDEYIAPVVVKKVRPIKHVASTKLKVNKVEVALPGQSYHPDFESHQDVVAEAVAQVLEQEEIYKEMKEPLSKGLSEETLQYIDQREDVDSDAEVSEEEEEDDDEEEEYIDEDGNVVKRKKNQETLTRSQRNKRARHKQLLVEQKSNKDKKTLLKQINNVQQILQEVIRDEKNSEQKQKVKKLIAEQKLEEEPMVRIGGKKTKLDREVPVALSDELNGSVRALKPKGDLLLERFDSLHKRNMIEVSSKTRRPQARKVKYVETK